MSASPFTTSGDLNHGIAHVAAENAGLVFNPAATPDVLLGMAIARAHRLQCLLNLLSCHVQGETAELVDILEPMSEEVVLVLLELQRLESESGK